MTPRRASSGDIGALVAAYEWLFAAPAAGPPASWDPQAATERLRTLLGPGEERFAAFVVDGGDGLTGFVTVYLDILSVRYGPRAWVEDLAVDPARRSQGAGKALLDAAKDWAREHGAAHLELDSAFVRADAHRFYEREQPSWDARSFGWVL